MFVEKISLNQVKKFNKGGIFNSFEWLSVYDLTKLSVWGIFNNNKELIGCFSTYKYKRAKFFNQLAPAPFMPSNGVYVIDKTSNPAQKTTFNKKVMELLSSFLDNQNENIKTFFFPPQYTDMQPFVWKGYTVAPRYTYQLNLYDTEDKLLENMSAERRKNIKKALKDGVVVKQKNVSEEAIKLIKNTFIKQKIKIDFTVLDKILVEFPKSKKTFSFLSYNDKGIPIAANFCVYDDNKAYYLFGGYDSLNKHEGAGALAMWEAIKYAKSLGVEIFDFEGSMEPNIEKYFRGFGGKITPYYTVNKSGFGIKMLMKLKRNK